MKEIMKIVTGCLLLLGLFIYLANHPAHAAKALSARDSAGTVVTIYPKPCGNEKIVADIHAKFPNVQLGDGIAVYRGEVAHICFAVKPDGDVIIIFEDGEGFKIPSRYFTPAVES